MEKEEIKGRLVESHEDFMEAIEGLTEEQMQEPGVSDSWSVKDIMFHISNWEAELVKLLWQAKQGQKPTTVHFSNKSVDELNQAWYEEAKNRPLDRVMADFQAVRRQTIRRVDSFSEKDLNDPKRYPWLDDHPLWTWIAQDSFDHEAEHIEDIENWRERLEI